MTDEEDEIERLYLALIAHQPDAHAVRTLYAQWLNEVGRDNDAEEQLRIVKKRENEEEDDRECRILGC